jgi:FkbH-like protein
MNTTEALKVLREAPEHGRRFDVTLACGFTPLHLQTFVAAHLQKALPARRVVVSTGLFGNLIPTVEGLERHTQALAVVIEWADLDPRLGFRTSPKWQSETLNEIVTFARAALERLRIGIQQLSSTTQVVVSLPTLPLPPIFHTPGWQQSESEALLQQMVGEFGLTLGSSGIAIVNQQRLMEESPPSNRYDLKSDLLLGLPYTLAHADTLALAIAVLLAPTAPKKGIITDLDDTLWSGEVGELGPDKVHWDLDSHSGLHGLYQSLLASLSENGVLVAVASKNELEVVETALQRADLLLPADRIFPLEVHWNTKSSSVERIIRKWNIAPDAVVFVDNSSAELAEVSVVHPGIECIQFPGKDYAAGYKMLQRLRDLFGKRSRSLEDGIRLESLKQSTHYEKAASEANVEGFLEQLSAVVRIDSDISSADTRILELVNKTNQFNLNGIRYTESDWLAELSKPTAKGMAISYQDKFGLLGKIAVLLGHLNGDNFHVRVWAMSCRAFGRRVEHLSLRTCFDSYPIRQIEFDFLETGRNHPLKKFLTSLGQTLNAPVILTREAFESVCPRLYHTISKTRRFDG